MRFVILYVLFILLILSCTPSTKKIDVKNDAGVVVETYNINADSLKVGEAKIFDDEGTLFDLSNYVEGKLEGKRTLYYRNGTVDTEENYANDVLVGEYVQYYKNGVPMQKGNYKNGVLSGEVISYYESGEIKESVTFSDNIENGPFTEYYPNGKKQWVGTYLNGDNEYGLLVEYDTQENVLKKMQCDSLGMCRTIWSKEKGDIAPSF